MHLSIRAKEVTQLTATAEAGRCEQIEGQEAQGSSAAVEAPGVTKETRSAAQHAGCDAGPPGLPQCPVKVREGSTAEWLLSGLLQNWQ